MSAGRIPTTANSPLTAKGDLFGYSTQPARLAVGANGETLVADSSTATGLRYTENYAAGKNKIINGDFGIWQRGTSFSNPVSGTYCADRFRTIHDGTGATRTVTQQTFTPGTAPQAGYESQYFMRYEVSVAGSGNTFQGMNQVIEDVRTFAGQPVTVSFWAKADASRTVNIDLVQEFGSGGSGSVFVTLSAGNVAATTAWQRFSVTGTVPSIAGKTIGTGSGLRFGYYAPAATVSTIDIWGVQVEYGSVATAFQTATGTIQGETSACQRYYVRWSGDTLAFVNANYYQTTNAYGVLPLPVEMRTAPTGTASGGTALNVFAVSAVLASSAVAFASISNKTARIQATTTASTLGAGAWMTINGATSFIEMSAEL